MPGPSSAGWAWTSISVPPARTDCSPWWNGSGRWPRPPGPLPSRNSPADPTFPMHTPQSVNLIRDVDANVVPAGTKVTLLKGETAHITQSLGGSYTVVVNGNMFRIDGKDADALGLKGEEKASAAGHAPRTAEQVEAEAWA